MLDLVRIILIEPSGPANVGAVCRAMFNFGLSSLWVVSPRCELNCPESRGYATHGRPILESARVVAELSEALADCTQSWVTTGKLGLYRRQSAHTPREAAATIVQTGASSPVAIAFGREDRGILTRELQQFDRVITIPANPDYPIMNLGAAAAVVMYELWQARLAAGGAAPLPTAINRELAVGARKEKMFELLFDALDKIDFFRGQSPEHLRYILRHTLGRVDLTTIESDVLTGMARQILYYVKHHP